MSSVARKRAGSIKVEADATLDDPNHHLTGPFLPQTHLDDSGSESPYRKAHLVSDSPRPSLLVRWATEPTSSLALLLLPIILYLNWELVSTKVEHSIPNPFAKFFLLSGYIPDSKPNDPQYQKTWWDLVFLAYYVVFFSFVRQAIFYVSRPTAVYFGLKKRAKIARFGEQAYAFFYFMVFGAWGIRIMATLPTYWYNTIEFWKDYPHWLLNPALKRYYLMQFAHWLQELLVLSLGLERARKDYFELVAHHIVTLWLIGWSYFMNFTHIGNAVYVSMDIPDAFLAFSKLLNYIRWDTAKIYSFVLFFIVWSYFRHYLNFWILWSVWFESPFTPESSRRWSFLDGVYLTNWMKNQIFLALLLLQLLNLFWYWLIIKVLIRAITTAQAEDDRSDDEDDEQNEALEDKED